jgi:hypothetical protein
MPKVAKDKATTAASKAAARRKTRGASCMGAEPVLNQDVPQVVVRASGAATASSGTISLWRNQTLAEKLRATIDRDFKWDDYHVNVRECGDPPMTLTTRLSEAYLRISAGQRLSAKLIRDLQVLYAPQGVTVQYPIRDKTQPFPLALKEALDCFQDDDLRMRAKTPLQLQLTLMQNTNQKQVALICEVMSKTQATSSPDQASCLCEFAKTIKRLEIDKTFPEEIDRFRPLLVRGYVAHWGFEKRKKRTLQQFTDDHKIGLDCVVPFAKFSKLVGAGANAHKHPTDLAEVISASDFGRKVFGHMSTGALAVQLKEMMYTAVGVMLDMPEVGEAEVAATNASILAECEACGATRALRGRISWDAKFMGQDMFLEALGLPHQVDQIIQWGIKETGVHIEVDGIPQAIEIALSRKPPPPKNVPRFTKAILQPIIDGRSAWDQLMFDNPTKVGEDLLALCEDALSSILTKDRNAAFEYGLIKAYLSGNLGIKRFHEKIIHMMPDCRNVKMDCKTFYASLLALNTTTFKQCASPAVRAYYDTLCTTFSQMAVLKPPRNENVWKESANMREVGAQAANFAVTHADDGVLFLTGQQALAALYDRAGETTSRGGLPTMDELRDLTVLKHCLTPDKEEIRAGWMDDAIKEAMGKGASSYAMVPLASGSSSSCAMGPMKTTTLLAEASLGIDDAKKSGRKIAPPKKKTESITDMLLS